MFIYADESGNTGRNIFSPPTYFRVGALLTIQDVEDRLRGIIEPTNIAAGRARLHAHEMMPGHAAELASTVLDGLDAGGQWQFLFGSIEKEYVAPTKFVDTIFDSGENLAVPGLWYNHRGFRHALCLVMDRALRDRYRRAFWDAYLHDDIIAIQDVVRRVADFIRTREQDRRVREITFDAFEYVLRHPEDFTLSAASGRRAYQGHTPNIIGFSFIFDSVHRFHFRTGSRPTAFIHDRQQEFGRSMRDWAALFGHLRRHDNNGFPELSVADYQLPELALPSSVEVFALQAVDLLLWILTRTDPILRPVRERLELNVEGYEISRSTSARIVAEFQHEMARPLSESAESRARSLLSEWESDRRERIQGRRGGGASATRDGSS